MSTNTAYKLTPNSQQLIKDFIKARYLAFGIENLRARYEKIDQALQLENAERRAKLQDFYSDTEIAIASEPVNTATSFLNGIYLGKPEVFETVTKNAALQGAATQIQALNQENAKATGWEREFPLFFRDCVKYNFGAIECWWEAEQTQVIGTNPEGAGAAAAIEAVLREGNRISRRDPYNTFYDTTVPINQVHAYGEFSGYNDRITMIELARRVEKLQVTGESQADNPIMNQRDIFSKNPNTTSNQFFTPTIRPEVQADKSSGNAMASFFGLGNLNTSKSAQRQLESNAYEYTVMYCRIIPSMFNIQVPGGDKPQVWKFIMLNWDTLIFAEKQTNVHNFFGLITTQVLEEGLQDQNKSIAELLIPIQNLSTKLYDARLQGIRRNISDRGIYMQGVIDKQHIDNDSPTAKVPMRPNMFVKDVRAAYQQIPYNDNLGPTILQELAFLERTADKTSQTNAPQRGQFQKGNKTLGEFNEVMANADANMRSMALLLEATCMSPMKTIIMTNILQYMPPTELTTDENGESIQLDPVTLRKAKLNFKLADGLRSKDLLLGTDGLNNFMNMVLQVPLLQQQYNLAGMIEYTFGLEGADLAQFKLPPAPAAAPAPAPTGGPNGQPT